jgi:2-polyprenyl-3-methyl-5-hydroxy-6-metoxy-1,4-benzoquinol methylase
MSQINLQSTRSLDNVLENSTITGSSATNWGIWERLVPDQIADDPASQRILQIHQRRYETAARYAKNKRVLDIACGVGYGSKMLQAAGATSVVGVDLCPETLVYARENHQAPGLQYICANAETFDWSEPFDLIVSFETLEHLPHPDLFIERMSQLLAPGGYFLLSVPLGETRHLDAYHLHAFSEKDIYRLFEQAGFAIERSRCDDWFLSRSDLLRWQKLYPESQASPRKLLFTQRGQKLIWDFIIRGGFNMPQLLIEARKDSELPRSGVKRKVLALE